MKPPVFNHQQYTDLEADYMILKAENEQLQKEVASLAIESIEREKTLAKLEAEVMQLWEAQRWIPVEER